MGVDGAGRVEGAVGGGTLDAAENGGAGRSLIVSGNGSGSGSDTGTGDGDTGTGDGDTGSGDGDGGDGTDGDERLLDGPVFSLKRLRLGNRKTIVNMLSLKIISTCSVQEPGGGSPTDMFGWSPAHF
ncbi:hypothetical protein ACTXJ8_07390 [Corynebacterium variabile]|uniref:hypothetical protein n=1 Tax=Corynebacterium variabile TaxID=1727 RepID=UPI003FD4C388